MLLFVQCATVAVRARDSQIRLFYLRIKGRRGHKIAIVATAKKLLKIIWHLLLTGEEYVDKDYVKKTITKSRKETLKLALEEATLPPAAMSSMIGLIVYFALQRFLGRGFMSQYRYTMAAGIAAGEGVAIAIGMAVVLMMKSAWIMAY